MKNENAIKRIEQAVAEIKADERLGYATATVVENAPLALVQLSLETQIRTLNWVLKILKEEGGE